MHSDSVPTSAEHPRGDALDLLIEQSQKLFATYDARRGNAETKAAGILTADVAIAALTATAVSVIKHASVLLLLSLFVLLAILAVSVICAVYTGSAAGLRPGVRPWLQRLVRPLETYLSRGASDQRGEQQPLLSTESSKYRDAVIALDEAAADILTECKDDKDDAIIVRIRALELWQIRRDDAHHLAQAKDRGAGAAGIVLGLALVWGAILFAVIIFAHVG